MNTEVTALEIKNHVKVYIMIFGLLAVLTLVTVGASYLNLEAGETIFLALSIATIKGSLVAGYFMHLISEKTMIKWVLMLTIFFFLLLMFLPTISVIDQVNFR
ncbi:MAG: cytochrome C oxidase subunit IV family protein [Fidelibacterota bacterium]